MNTQDSTLKMSRQGTKSAFAIKFNAPSNRVDIPDEDSDDDEYEYKTVKVKRESRTMVKTEPLPTGKPLNTMTKLEQSYADLAKAEQFKPVGKKSTSKTGSATKPRISRQAPDASSKTHGYQEEDMKEILWQLYTGWKLEDVVENMFQKAGNTRDRSQWKKKITAMSKDMVSILNPEMNAEDSARGVCYF